MTSIYVGTYTEPPAGAGPGVLLFDFDDTSGDLAFRSVFDAGPNPSFLAIDAGRRRLYAVNELDDGAVSAFDRDPSNGDLRLINRKPSHGGSPCFAGFDASGRHLLVANYGGGTAAAFPIDDEGGLAPASAVIDHRRSPIEPRRETPPHPHMIAPSPDGRFIVVTDLGLDAALLYEFENEAFRPAGQGVVKAETGAGPRHFAFSPDGQTAYVINELNSTLDVFAYDGATFARRQTVSSLPAGFAGTNSCAQVLVAPDGRFVYGSNRGHDSIAIWTVDAEGIVGDVRVVASGGACPRNFALSPDGRWLIAANQDTNNLVVFARDAETGGLRRTDQTIEVDSPVCVIFCD